MGLRDRIKVAKSRTEVEQLLAEGATYKGASSRTIEKWKRAARAKYRELPAGEKEATNG